MNGRGGGKRKDSTLRYILVTENFCLKKEPKKVIRTYNRHAL